jgi:hypothetical protein
MFAAGFNAPGTPRDATAAEIRALRDWLVPEELEPTGMRPCGDTYSAQSIKSGERQRLRALLTAEAELAENTEPASEPVAWLWEYIGPHPYPQKRSPVARSLHEMDPANPPFPDDWKPIAPLYTLPLPLPTRLPQC